MAESEHGQARGGGDATRLQLGAQIGLRLGPLAAHLACGLPVVETRQPCSGVWGEDAGLGWVQAEAEGGG